MEQIQQPPTGDDHDHDQAQDGGTGKIGSNYLCRQSSTRWTPTTEQIKILKDLYYNNGVRSPTADQIQNITARLRKFGKIEGKNVFYWFQNHKARERQKKRFTEHNHHLPTMQRASNIRYPTGISCPPSAAGVVSGGQMVGGCGYGHKSMESNFRECAISACAGNGGICSFPNQSFQWAGVNPYIHQSYSFLEGTRNPSADHHEFQFQDEDQEYDQTPPELETLPLFPMHAEDQEPPPTSFCGANMMRSQPADYCYTSLELSLNSYGDQ